MSQSYNYFFEKPHNPPDIFSNPNPKEFISICINSIAKVNSEILEQRVQSQTCLNFAEISV